MFKSNRNVGLLFLSTVNSFMKCMFLFGISESLFVFFITIYFSLLHKKVIFGFMAIVIKTLEYFLFNIGGYFDGYNEIRIKDDMFEISKSKEDHLNILPDPVNTISDVLKNDLISVLNEIHIVKWNKKYYNNEICDGTQWEVEMRYNNRKTSKLSFGSNEYPKITKQNQEVNIESSDEYTKEFKKLLKLLNKIADQKNYFY